MKVYLESIFRKTTLKVIDDFKDEYKIDQDYSIGNSDIVVLGYDNTFKYTGLMKAYSFLNKQYKVNVNQDEMAKKIREYALFFDKESGKEIISEIQHAQGFLNINIHPRAIIQNCWKLCNDFIEADGEYFKIEAIKRKKIAIDYSSPNMAKSLHIGHLRSTIIGHTIVRTLEAQGHDVTGVNHVGDWGTQFGMIIFYLKKLFDNNHEKIMIYIEQSNSDELMNIYRNAKTMFDNKPVLVLNDSKDEKKDKYVVLMEADKNFVENCRNETALLQQGDEFNVVLWKKICQISREDFDDIYKVLNVHNLNEIGESFYQKYIPKIIKLLQAHEGLVKKNDGSLIIMLDGWSIPLFLVKSNGSYGYDTTDLAALYYRLVLQKYDHVIYITDIGQRKHFDMCFEVAKIMGWLNDTNTVKHIGFGLVNLKSGKKIKTRSGDVILMKDVIDDVINEAKEVIKERAKDQSLIGSYYDGMENKMMDIICQKIGINTLKYFDLSHSHSVSYKYDPNLMFRWSKLL